MAGRHQNSLPDRQAHPGVRDMGSRDGASRVAKAG